MKVSLSWLSDYISINKESYNSLADALTMVGLEVDSITDRFDYLDSVVAGRILNIKSHPNAENLQICYCYLWSVLVLLNFMREKSIKSIHASKEHFS